MQTVTVKTVDGIPHAVPVALNFSADGGLVCDLAGDMMPENCDHAGQTYSDNLALCCTRCGIPMFLPPRHLACRSAAVIDAMYKLWERAGWPSFLGGKWSTNPEYWTMYPHPLFAQVGGLPVRFERLAAFTASAQP